MPDLTTTMDSLVACLCSALENIDRATCECGLTIGIPGPGPAGCCECDEDAGGQAAGYLERVYPADPTTFEQITTLANCRPSAKAADVVLTVIRCYPTMTEQGQMPDMATTTEFAHNMNSDITAAWNALECCGERLVIREAFTQGDPEGGCSGFAIRVSVMVSMPQSGVDPS